MNDLRWKVDGGGFGVVVNRLRGDVDGVDATEAMNWAGSCGVEQPL